jgi:secreted Zn-dependent insulinase-like peptidase
MPWLLVPDQVSCHGYSQKLPVLLDMLIDHLANFTVKADR